MLEKILIIMFYMAGILCLIFPEKLFEFIKKFHRFSYRNTEFDPIKDKIKFRILLLTILFIMTFSIVKDCINKAGCI